ncbi:hypothetical protein RN001_011339 [Aquatica leii]|uniref:DJ-1/PfpI domain-containing protein n=1 Tax=Aquatica leii TaxID=1421715 RepID=A0AAN7SNP6_9COLE|nr:hypothetical protein RN001_011339 [Aquatica leii]
MVKKALVLIAEGTEEMECVISVDVLRRAGVEVTLAGIAGNDPVKCSRNVVVVPDSSLCDATSKGPYDAIVLPGGLGGSKAFAECKELGQLLKEQETAGRIVAAICAAPTALNAHSIALGKSITSYPSVEAQVMQNAKYNYKTDSVVVDGNLTTSRGPGTAFQFALSLAEQLTGKEKATEVAKAMLL